jgi:two-component system, NtrC family, response regulator AtoC
MSRHNVLVVDDEVKMQRILEIMLNDMNLDVACADNGQAALEIMAKQSVDLIITDMRMPVMDGIELLRALHDQGEVPPVIMITAHGTVQSAVEAMRLGAVDYITRPFEIESVELAVHRALKLSRVQRENQFLRDELATGWAEFVGLSAPMREMYDFIEKVGPSAVPVLIVGETGTGKELVARAVHNASGRQGIFVPVNCAGIPETLLESELFGHIRGAFTGAVGERAGKFEISDGGTLFLDEITEMPITLQTRLLRAVQESYIERLGSNRRIDLDLRIIAATNRDPIIAVSESKLREDLYYRLNGFRMDVPALRERGDDIALLAEHFLRAHAGRMGKPTPTVSARAQHLLGNFKWPGNVRELDNLMGRAVLLAIEGDIESVLMRELGGSLAEPPVRQDAETNDDLRLQLQVDALECKLIESALSRCGDNKAKAARLLEVSERTLWYKLKKLGIRS